MPIQLDLRERAQRFSLRIIRLFRALPRSPEAQVIGKQLLRSGTSVGANYWSVGRARSTADFIAKLAIVIEEADETMFWLDCLAKAEIVPAARLNDIQKEAEELVRIFVASQQTARDRRGAARTS